MINNKKKNKNHFLDLINLVNLKKSVVIGYKEVAIFITLNLINFGKKLRRKFKKKKIIIYFINKIV